jgi:O-antigen/teichoic acid export membrane protein
MGEERLPWLTAGYGPTGSLRAKTVAQFRALLTARYQSSIVRRVAVLLIFIGPAFLINLLVYYFTARILSAEAFGLFYVAVTLGNVAFSGSLVLNIFFTRFLVQVEAKQTKALVAATHRIQRVMGLWGAAVAISAGLLLGPLSKSMNVQSPFIVLLVIADTYVAYLGDVGRAYLQARRKTWQLGTYSLVWMGLRLLLCVLGASIFGTVWATLAGSVLSGCAIVAAFQIMLARDAPPDLNKAPALPTLSALAPVTLGYGLLILVSNLDIILTYFLLPGAAIGIYSASSVFPKGILVATTPIVQMLFAVMMGDRDSAEAFRVAMHKTILVIAALSAGAALSVWVLSPWLCGSNFGLKLCAPAPLHILLVSSLLLAVLRITVLLEFVRQRDWLILSLVLPTLGFLVFVWQARPGIEALAQQFTAFAAATLIFFVVIQLATPRWQRPG